ncbi:zinc finger BED domain-containing protein RICESLEEPER 2 isoform X1 [Coffea arabica]|uniref:Zinc finger BED domain-containing protein RICESLEEPER 2 isoform X1 n=2 Tax=Coffea arabica TaxID=13443 RepID=A0A6P6WJZ0_COFAR|nr:zinc finger BED domain-containing protein RICESLEEPER 2-like isoform X1 [Coffea arabica]
MKCNKMTMISNSDGATGEDFRILFKMDISMTYPNSVTIEEDSDTGSSSDSIKETGHTNQESQCPDTSAIGKKKLPPKATIGVPGKKRRLTSEVWDYFNIIPKKDPNEELKCQCKKCGNEYSAESKSGTGNLHRHIKKCVKMTTKDIGQYLITSDKGALGTRNAQFSQDKFRELLVHAIVRHELPFSFVEYEGIKNVLTYLEPQIKHITRNTAKSDIKKLHAREINRLGSELRGCPSRICLTSDAWTSIVTDGYLSLTAHYIDSNWLLQKKILNFSYMPPPHNGVALAEKIYSLASSWGIEKKLFSITLDNASANDSCVAILKNQLKLKNSLVCDGVLFHVRCCAHILNLIVQDGLKEIDKSVELIRECVKYVKGSQTRKLRFTECVTQTSLDSKKALVQDVPTRWNSTYRMLSSALYYRLAFCHLQLSDSNFRCCPSLEEWGRVEKICSFLQVFYEATNAFSGSKYPTSNLYFPQVFKIQLKLSEECKSSDDFMKRIGSQMFVKFNKYWSEFNLLLAIAVVFDPRYKFQFIEFSYNKLYGPGSNELVKIRNALFDVYNEYVRTFNISGASSSCSRGSNEVYSHGAKDQEDNQSFDVLEEFDQFDTFEFASSAQKSQLEMYLDEPRAKRSSHINVLDYWKAQQFRFPDLSKLARDILCVPVSTVASESAFSLGGRILDQFRSSLSPQIVEALVCTKDWLFGDKSEGSLNMNLEDLTQNIMSLNINKDEVDATIIEDSNSNIINL